MSIKQKRKRVKIMPTIHNGILGVITQDIKMLETKTGKTLAQIIVANNYGYGASKGVDYVTCVANGKVGEMINKNFKKGDFILVEGEFHNKPYRKGVNPDGQEFNLQNWQYSIHKVHFLPYRKNRGTEVNAEEQKDYREFEEIPPAPDDADVPF